MKERLYILLEGDDDEKFFKKVFKPILKEKYEVILCWPYAEENKKIFINLVKSFKKEEADYFILGDLDDRDSVSTKKIELMERSNNEADVNKIIIVVKIMEGWYLAGISSRLSEHYSIVCLDNTDVMTINDFNEIVQGKVTSVNLFKSEILREFNIEDAKRKNKSFDYFYKLLMS